MKTRSNVGSAPNFASGASNKNISAVGTSSNKINQSFFEVKIPRSENLSRSEVKIIAPIEIAQSEASIHDENKASIEYPADLNSLLSSDHYEVSEADDETYDVESLT